MSDARRQARTPRTPTFPPWDVGDLEADGARLLLDLRQRGVVVEAVGEELHWRAPAGVMAADDVATLRAWKAELVAVLAELAALERDRTAGLWRGLYETLPEDDRERVAAEVVAGDPIAARLVLCLDLPGPMANARRGTA
jgi:hypothetical protein